MPDTTDGADSLHSRTDVRRESPSARAITSMSLHEILEQMGLSQEDEMELVDRIRSMGEPDPVLKERIGFEQTSLQDACASPLRRTTVEAIPGSGEEATSFVETFYLPSGRLVQLRRRYPSAAELDVALRRDRAYLEPALWIREISPRPRGDEWVSAALVDEMSVVDGL